MGIVLVFEDGQDLNSDLFKVEMGALFEPVEDKDEGVVPELYVLAQVDYYTFALIGLESGNRFANPVKIQCRPNLTLTRAEWSQVAGGKPGQFRPILKPYTHVFGEPA